MQERFFWKICHMIDGWTKEWRGRGLSSKVAEAHMEQWSLKDMGS